MSGAQLAVLILGIAIVLGGFAVWALRPAEPTAANTLKFLGSEFTLNTPALAVMAFGVVLILIALNSSSPPGPQGPPRGDALDDWVNAFRRGNP
jgi:hypothetical protein